MSNQRSNGIPGALLLEQVAQAFSIHWNLLSEVGGKSGGRKMRTVRNRRSLPIRTPHPRQTDTHMRVHAHMRTHARTHTIYQTFDQKNNNNKSIQIRSACSSISCPDKKSVEESKQHEGRQFSYKKWSGQTAKAYVRGEKRGGPGTPPSGVKARSEHTILPSLCPGKKKWLSAEIGRLRGENTENKTKILLFVVAAHLIQI